MVTKTERVVEKQQVNDKFIMKYTEGLSEAVCKKVQACRLYLQVTTLADICDITGTWVDRRIMRGDMNRKSTLVWTTQAKPPRSYWQEWKKLVGSLVYEGTCRLREGFVLGKWVRSYQKWRWTISGNVITDWRDSQQYATSKELNGTMLYGKCSTGGTEGLPVLVTR